MFCGTLLKSHSWHSLHVKEKMNLDTIIYGGLRRENLYNGKGASTNTELRIERYNGKILVYLRKFLKLLYFSEGNLLKL